MGPERSSAGHENSSRSNAENLSGNFSGIGFKPPVVQRYKTNASTKTTEHDLYKVTATNSLLYVANDAATGLIAPVPNLGGGLVIRDGTRKFLGVNYDKYKYDDTQRFSDDCLKFAENFSRGETDDEVQSSFRGRENRGHGQQDRLFGANNPQNVSIANSPNFNQGENANPAIGEAYATTRTVAPIGGEHPYHVAFVVAKDAPDNVTLETDASNPLPAPVFDIYDTTPSHVVGRTLNSQTFHEAYLAAYTSARPGINHPPATGELYPR